MRSALAAAPGRLCPKGSCVGQRVDHHRQESHRIMDIFATAGAVIEPMFIDEAFLDAAAACQGDADSSQLKAAAENCGDVQRRGFHLVAREKRGIRPLFKLKYALALIPFAAEVWAWLHWR
jgi:nucleotidyltransferase/DNA polymerase involved in DNA repair